MHSFSTTKEGYQTRARSQVATVKQLVQVDAWSASGGEDFEDARDVVAMLRRTCKSSKSSGK